MYGRPKSRSVNHNSWVDGMRELVPLYVNVNFITSWIAYNPEGIVQIWENQHQL